MKKLMLIGLLAAFVAGCTAPELNEDTTAYGTDKSKSVTTEGDSQDYDLDNSED